MNVTVLLSLLFFTAILKSFFQNNLIGIKMIRYISWQRAGTTSVVYMTTSY